MRNARLKLWTFKSGLGLLYINPVVMPPIQIIQGCCHGFQIQFSSARFLQLHRQVNDGTSNPQGVSHFWPHARGRMLQHPGTTPDPGLPEVAGKMSKP